MSYSWFFVNQATLHQVSLTPSEWTCKHIHAHTYFSLLLCPSALTDGTYICTLEWLQSVWTFDVVKKALLLQLLFSCKNLVWFTNRAKPLLPYISSRLPEKHQVLQRVCTPFVQGTWIWQQQFQLFFSLVPPIPFDLMHMTRHYKWSPVMGVSHSISVLCLWLFLQVHC